MNQEVENKNLENSKKRLKIYYSLLVSVLCFIGVSFAFFQLFLRQTDNNGISALNCFSSTLTEETSAINLTDEFPITDENGMKKTPFTFKVTNNCDNYVKIYITMDSLKEGQTGYIQSKYMKANVSTKGTTDGTSLIIGNQNTKILENKDNGYILKEVGLNSKESKEFDLRLWIDYDTTKEQAAGMTYTSQVVIVTEPGNPPLRNAILADNDVKTPLTTPGSEASAHTLGDSKIQTRSVSSTYQSYYITYGTGYETNGTKFNLIGAAVTSDTYANSYSSLVGKYLVSDSLSATGSSTAGTMKTTTNLSQIYYVVSATLDSYTYKALSSTRNTTEALLASTEDDYGTSYYFRGAVKNNYVQFANKCWRIVRINGDGSVKLVLHNDNITGVSNPCSSANNSDAAAFARYSPSYYNTYFNNFYSDNTFIGFMYGTVGSSDYASTHANVNKSEILTLLEAWYETNLSSYESKLADIIWCNDKSTANGGLGYEFDETFYAAYNRLVSTKTPTLICPNDNNGGKLSKFTVSDTTNGNGNLTYKIGLLTADEVVFAGSVYGAVNSSSYLQENTGITSWWTMSPFYFNGGAAGPAENCYVSSGYLGGTIVAVGSALRPAISLVSDTTISGGSGTSEDPYIID